MSPKLLRVQAKATIMNLGEIVELDVEEYAALYAHVFNSKPWNENWSAESALARLDYYRRTPGFFGISAHDNSETDSDPCSLPAVTPR